MGREGEIGGIRKDGWMDGHEEGRRRVDGDGERTNG